MQIRKTYSGTIERKLLPDKTEFAGTQGDHKTCRLVFAFGHAYDNFRKDIVFDTSLTTEYGTYSARYTLTDNYFDIPSEITSTGSKTVGYHIVFTELNPEIPNRPRTEITQKSQLRFSESEKPILEEYELGDFYTAVYKKTYADSKYKVNGVTDRPEIIFTALSGKEYVLPLDMPFLSGGKIPRRFLDEQYIQDLFFVTDDSELVGLEVQLGDFALNTTTDDLFVLTSDEPGVLENWLKIYSPNPIFDNLDILGDLDVVGDTNIDKNLHVKGTSLLEGDVEVNSNLRVDENVDVGLGLVVEGDASVGSLEVLNDAVVEGNVHVIGDLDVDGSIDTVINVNAQTDLTAGQDLKSGRDTSVGRNLDVVGDAEIHGNLQVDGSIDTVINVTAQTDLVAGQDLKAGRDLQVESNSLIKGNSEVKGTLKVDGTIDSLTDITAGRDVTALSNVNAGEDIYSGRDAFVGRNLEVDADALVKGNASVLGDLQVNGSIDTVINVNAQTDLTAGQDLKSGRDTEVGRNLIVEGTSKLEGDVTADADVQIAGSVEVLTDAVVRGNASIKGDLDVDGSIDTVINVNAQTDLTAGQDLKSGRDTSVGRNLDVVGDAEVHGDLHVDGSINTVIDVNAQNDLTSIRDIKSGRNLEVAEDVLVNGNEVILGTSEIGGDTYLRSDLLVDGNAVIGTDVLKSDFIVKGDIGLTDNIDVGGDIGTSILADRVIVTDADGVLIASAITKNEAESLIEIQGNVQEQINTKEAWGNKTSQWNTTPSDTRYPTEKLVKDSLDLKADDTTLTAHKSDKGNPHAVTKAQVGLGNADNTSDINKPISSATQTALDTKVNKNNAITAGTFTKITYDAKGLVTGGVILSATDIPDLDTSKTTSGVFDLARIPSLPASRVTSGAFVDARIPTNIERNTNKVSVFQTTPTDTAYPTEKLVKASLDLKTDDSAFSAHTGNSSNPHAVTKTQVGLGNVNNTSDINKPISSATQTALDALDTSISTHANNKNNPHAVTKAQVGLDHISRSAIMLENNSEWGLHSRIDSTAGSYASASTWRFSNERCYDVDGKVIGAHELRCANGTTSRILQVNQYTLDGATVTGSLDIYVNQGGDRWVTHFMRPAPGASDAVNTKYVLDRLGETVDYIEETAVKKTGNESIAGIKSFSDNVEIGTVLVPKQLSIKGNLLIDGNITQNGSTYETHAQQVYTTDDKIIMRDGATAGLISGATSGLTFKKYDGTNDGELSVDSSGTARVGDVGDLQPLATRNESDEMTDDLPIVWDADGLKLITRQLTRGDVGLSNVDNTSDINKPISTATQTALDGKVSKSGDTMTGSLNINTDGAYPLAITTDYPYPFRIRNRTLDIPLFTLYRPSNSTTPFIQMMGPNGTHRWDLGDGGTRYRGNHFLHEDPPADDNTGSLTSCRWVNSRLSPLATDSAVVHKTGNEEIAGIKTFKDGISQKSTFDIGVAGYAYRNVNRLIDVNNAEIFSDIISKESDKRTAKRIVLRNKDTNGDDIKIYHDEALYVDGVYKEYVTTPGNANFIYRYLNPDGTGYSSTPYRAYAQASNNDVLTKGHVADILTPVVKKTGNETIDGLKIFTSQLETRSGVVRVNTPEYNTYGDFDVRSTGDDKCTASIILRRMVGGTSKRTGMMGFIVDGDTAYSTVVMRATPGPTDIIHKGYLDTRLSPLATDSAVVHKTGNESIAGVKSFSDNVEIGTTQVPKQLSIKGNLLIDGNITQNGSTYETHAQQVYTTDDKIIMRDGATAGLLAGATSGLTFNKYDGTNDGELSVDSSGTARVGDVGDLQPLATRNEAGSMTNNQPVVWDASSLKMVTRALVAGDIPDLDAGKIISGTIADERIPSGITRDTELTAHTSRTDNPHSVTKAQVGLGNADNTSDVNKPISTATQTALDGAVKKTGDVMTGHLYANNGITLERPGQSVITHKRTDRGYNSPWGRYRWDVIRDMDNKNVGELAFICTNDSGRLSSCIITSTNYKDDETAVSSSISVRAHGSGETSVSLPMQSSPISSDAVNVKYVLDRLGETVDFVNGEVGTHATRKDNPHSVTKAQVGLSNVDNTSDASKPVSTATQNALNGTVKKTGNESIAGIKSFSDNVEIGTTLVPKQLSIKGNLLIDGNITQNGSAYETHAQQVYTTDDKIIMRDGATGGLISGATSGLTFKKYDGTIDGELSVDSSGTARVGDVGDLQPLATRNEAGSMTNNQPVVWDASSLKMVTRALVAGDIPDLDAGKIISGTIADERIPSGITRDTELTAHTSRTDNPHSVTKAQVGLGAYPASPADIGISTATQTALDGTVKKTGNEEISGIKTFKDAIYQKSTLDLGMGGYNARAINRILDVNGLIMCNSIMAKNTDKSTLLSTTIGNKNENEEYISVGLHKLLHVNGQYVEYMNPSGGGTIYFRRINTDGTGFSTTPMRTSPASSDVANTKYVIDQVSGMVDYVDGEVGTHEARKDNPHSVTKAQVGLSNVDNTSDTAKPISTATQNALNGTVKKTGNEEISGIKTFVDYMVIPMRVNPQPSDAVNKGHVDGLLTSKQDKLTFDNTPVSGSSNPVKSGGVHSALAGKQDKLTFDNVPVSGSNNPVKSGGVYNALAEFGALTFDDAPVSGSTNPVKSGGIYNALATKQASITGGATTIASSNLTASRALVSDGSGKVAVSAVTSTQLGYVSGVTSAIQTQLNGKQSTLTFDSTPTASSTNPVTSNGIKVAIDAKVNRYTGSFTGNNSLKSFQISHNLNDAYPNVTVWKTSGGVTKITDVEIISTSANIITLTFAVAPTSTDSFNIKVVS